MSPAENIMDLGYILKNSRKVFVIETNDEGYMRYIHVVEIWKVGHKHRRKGSSRVGGGQNWTVTPNARAQSINQSMLPAYDNVSCRKYSGLGKHFEKFQRSICNWDEWWRMNDSWRTHGLKCLTHRRPGRPQREPVERHRSLHSRRPCSAWRIRWKSFCGEFFGPPKWECR